MSGMSGFNRRGLYRMKQFYETYADPQLPTHLFRDPYVFDFFDLPEPYSESDLEKVLIKNLQKFILEIGKGFTYIGNQFRLQVGSKDYRMIALLFCTV